MLWCTKMDKLMDFFDSDARIPVEQAMLLRNSLTDLRGFAAEHHEDIVRDFFVVFACPLESNRGGFPIFLFPKCNGSADCLCAYPKSYDLIYPGLPGTFHRIIVVKTIMSRFASCFSKPTAAIRTVFGWEASLWQWTMAAG